MITSIKSIRYFYRTFKLRWKCITGFSVKIFKRSPSDPFIFELGVPNKISVIKSLFYTVMSCQPCASQGRIAFHFLRPNIFFCVKYAIFCVNENPALFIFKYIIN